MKKGIFILASLFVLSCGSDDNTTAKTNMKLVTGLTFRQNFDDAPYLVGNPNVLNDNKFVIYPNPALETFMVAAQGSENITDVWVVPASAEKIYQNEDFGTVLHTGLYPEATIETNAAASANGQSAETIAVNIGTLPKGYYRVFVKIDGEVYWDNLYKFNDDANTEADLNALVDFWE